MATEKSVLIVEDEVLVGMMLAKKLKSQGFHVCDIVSTGEDAVVAAAQYVPHAVLMDVSLAGAMDGIEAAARIREISGTEVIFFTGYHQDKVLMKRAEQVGALAVLDKLGPLEDILAALEAVFSTKE